MANNLIDKNGRVNYSGISKKIEKQQEIFADVDATMAILEKLPEMADVALDFLNADSFNFSANPMDFLFKILKKLGVGEDTLREWIVDILTVALPAIEVGVKGMLLSNIKSIISCDFDPRIPWYLRKNIDGTIYVESLLTGDFAERGLDIPLSVIDPEGMLDLSPFVEPGVRYYFSQSEDVNEDSNSKISKLARADDFNAFLWYVIHKGRQNPIAVDLDENGVFQYGGIYYTATTNNSVAASMKGVIDLMCPTSKEFIVGTTFCDYGDPREILICIEKYDGLNVLVPLSSDWWSCNWYADRSKYFKNNIVDRKAERNYENENGICSLAYTNIGDYKGSAVTKPPLGLDNLRFMVLPKPAVIIPNIGKDSNGNIKANWRFVRLLFDADGTPNKKGRYSLPGEVDTRKTTATTEDGWDIYINGTVGTTQTEILFNQKTGEYKLKDDTGVSALVECYPGLTVYEFNYDYIMGMRLFDPKVVCERIFAASTNAKYRAGFSLRLNRQKDKTNYPFTSGKERITKIVEKILESDEEELNDCFYKFSNTEYDELLEKTARLKYNQSPYTEGYGDGQVIDLSSVEAVLETYPVNGTIEEQKQVLSKALEQACNSVEDAAQVSSNNGQTNSVRASFLTNVLQQLTACVVDSIMSPKVLMLLFINNELMTDCGDMLTTDQLMGVCKNIVTSLIKEVRDLIMQKMLDYIMKFLMPMILEIQAYVLSEQFAAYMAIIKLLLSYYNAGVISLGRLNAILSSLMSKFKNSKYDSQDYEIPSIFDDINYSDVFGDMQKQNGPILNNCVQ